LAATEIEFHLPSTRKTWTYFFGVVAARWRDALKWLTNKNEKSKNACPSRGRALGDRKCATVVSQDLRKQKSHPNLTIERPNLAEGNADRACDSTESVCSESWN
jgi:hypothetical protein